MFSTPSSIAAHPRGDVTRSEPSDSWSSGKSWIVLFGVFSVSVVLYWLLRFPNAPLDADSYVYLSGAKSFAEGTGYRMAWHANLPAIGIYPPGNSMWLSWFWPKGATFDDAFPRIAFGVCLLGGAVNAAVAAFLLRGGLPRWMALSFTALWCVSPLWVQGLHFFMSDPAFLLFNLVGMTLFVRVEGELSLGRWFLLGLLLGASLVWRSAGLGLVAGVALILWGSRKSPRHWIAALALPVALLLTKGLWVGTGGTGYRESFAAFVVESGGYTGLAWEKAVELLSWISGRYFFEGVFPAVSRISVFLHPRSLPASHAAAAAMFLLFLVLLAVARLGWRRLGKSGKAIGWVLLIYSIQVFVAPNEGWYSHRYLANVWILGLLCLGLGLLEICPEWRKSGMGQRSGFLGVLGLLVLVNGIASWRTKQVWDQPRWRADLHEAARRIQELGGGKANVAVNINGIPAVYLGDAMGGRLVECYLETRRTKRAPIFLRHVDQGNVPADFLLALDNGLPLESAPILERVPLSPSSRVRLFRIVPGRSSVGAPQTKISTPSPNH